jgi:hypothetical protein
MKVCLPPPPEYLEPVSSLHLDLSDGLHLIEFLLRLVISRELSMIKSESSYTKSTLERYIQSIYEKYRQLVIPKPQFKVQMRDNLSVAWSLISDEMKPNRIQEWLKSDEQQNKYGTQRPSKLMQKLQLREIRIEDVLSAKQESIAILLHEISQEFPNSFENCSL